MPGLRFLYWEGGQGGAHTSREGIDYDRGRCALDEGFQGTHGLGVLLPGFLAALLGAQAHEPEAVHDQVHWRRPGSGRSGRFATVTQGQTALLDGEASVLED